MGWLSDEWRNAKRNIKKGASTAVSGTKKFAKKNESELWLAAAAAGGYLALPALGAGGAAAGGASGAAAAGAANAGGSAAAGAAASNPGFWGSVGSGIGTGIGAGVGGAVGLAGADFVNNLLGKPTNPTEYGYATRDYNNAAYPGTTPWEQLGGAKPQVNEMENAKQQRMHEQYMQARQLKTQEKIATMQSRATVIGAGEYAGSDLGTAINMLATGKGDIQGSAKLTGADAATTSAAAATVSAEAALRSSGAAGMQAVAAIKNANTNSLRQKVDEVLGKARLDVDWFRATTDRGKLQVDRFNAETVRGRSEWEESVATGQLDVNRDKLALEQKRLKTEIYRWTADLVNAHIPKGVIGSVQSNAYWQDELHAVGSMAEMILLEAYPHAGEFMKHLQAYDSETYSHVLASSWEKSPSAWQDTIRAIDPNFVLGTVGVYGSLRALRGIAQIRNLFKQGTKTGAETRKANVDAAATEQKMKPTSELPVFQATP